MPALKLIDQFLKPPHQEIFDILGLYPHFQPGYGSPFRCRTDPIHQSARGGCKQSFEGPREDANPDVRRVVEKLVRPVRSHHGILAQQKKQLYAIPRCMELSLRAASYIAAHK